MKSKLMWVVYLIASFGAFHYGLVAFGWNLFALKFLVNMPMLTRAIQLLFGACGLASIITLFMECKECK